MSTPPAVTINIGRLQTRHPTPLPPAPGQNPAPPIVLQGERGPQGPPGDASARPFEFMDPSVLWTVRHNLGRYPAVFLVDTTGEVFEASIHHVDPGTLTIAFTYPMAGTAYLT